MKLICHNCPDISFIEENSDSLRKFIVKLGKGEAIQQNRKKGLALSSGLSRLEENSEVTKEESYKFITDSQTSLNIRNQPTQFVQIVRNNSENRKFQHQNLLVLNHSSVQNNQKRNQCKSQRIVKFCLLNSLPQNLRFEESTCSKPAAKQVKVRFTYQPLKEDQNHKNVQHTTRPESSCYSNVNTNRQSHFKYPQEIKEKSYAFSNLNLFKTKQTHSPLTQRDEEVKDLFGFHQNRKICKNSPKDWNSNVSEEAQIIQESLKRSIQPKSNLIKDEKPKTGRPNLWDAKKVQSIVSGKEISQFSVDYSSVVKDFFNGSVGSEFQQRE